MKLEFVRGLARAPRGFRAEHQKANAALALAAARYFDPGCDVADLDDANWPGRSEEIQVGQARVIFDVAHNADSIDALVCEHKSSPPRFVVFGCRSVV